jgi:hypothetical protein
MTHEEIEAAIERLEKLGSKGFIFDTDIVDAVNDSTNMFEVRGTIIGLLRQADPYSHIELPLDADDEVIHIGDNVYAKYNAGYYLNGKVDSITFAEDAVFVGIKDGEDEDEFKASTLHHDRHIPTVRQILEDCVNEAFNLGVDTADSDRLITRTYNDKKAMAKACAMKLVPLLSDEAETGYEADVNDN